MDKRDFYFRERVSQGTMDQVFDYAEAADHHLATDHGLVGIVEALDVSEHSPAPALSVDVAGPGAAYDKAGQRIAMAEVTSVVDCSQDEYGVPIDLGVLPGQARVVSVFARFLRIASDPKIDGNNLTVYTQQREGAELFVRMGAAAGAGAEVPPPLLADALLLADLTYLFGQATFQASDISVARRQDWFRAALPTMGTVVHGTALAAVGALFTAVDTLFSGAATPVVVTSLWNDGSGIAALNVQDAFNEVVADLAEDTGTPGADLVGADLYATGSGFCDLARGSVQDQLHGIADAVDGHIAGGAPAHPASAVTFTPVGHLAATDVQAALAEVDGEVAFLADDETFTSSLAVTAGVGKVGFAVTGAAGQLAATVAAAVGQTALRATGGNNGAFAVDAIGAASATASPGGNGIQVAGGNNTSTGLPGYGGSFRGGAAVTQVGGGGVIAWGGDSTDLDGGIAVWGEGGSSSVSDGGVGGYFRGGAPNGDGVYGLGSNDGWGGHFLGGNTGGGAYGFTSAADKKGLLGANSAGADNVGAGVHGLGAHCYGVIAEGQYHNPDRAAFRIVPQDFLPATGQDGDLVSLGGVLWMCSVSGVPGTWGKVGLQH